MKVFTIGTNKKSAEVFFKTLEENKVKGIIDIRLNNNSQLNGFTKGKDLDFFLRKIWNLDYIYMPNLAPTKEILNSYKKKEIDWEKYVEDFTILLKNREIDKNMKIEKYENYCFLCSEETAEKCHRRLVVEYLSKGKKIEIIHL